MEHWTSDIWGAVIVAFIVGLLLGYVVIRATKGSVQKQLKIEAELKATNAQLEAQKQQLEQHFSQSATLLATLAEDYKKLYQHLAKGSEHLLPSETQIAFFQQPQLENKATTEENPPKDYSEGSSGLLKS